MGLIFWSWIALWIWMGYKSTLVKNWLGLFCSLFFILIIIIPLWIASGGLK